MSTPLVIVDVPAGPDRSIFWRDAEAALRMSNPKNIARFLGDLIQVRAHDEAEEAHRAGRCTEFERIEIDGNGVFKTVKEPRKTKARKLDREFMAVLFRAVSKELVRKMEGRSA